MGVPEKKPNRYGVLVVYLFAIVCLLMGLFLPLYNGNGILALCLPDVLNIVANSVIISTDKLVSFSYAVNLFGLHLNAGAYVMLLYFVVTFLALVALIPIAVQVAKDRKKNCVLEYVVLVAEAIVLSAYMLIALQLDGVSYNMLIAYGGTVVALIVLGFMNKGKTGGAKFVLFLLSALAALMLYDFAVVIPSLADGLNGMGDSIRMYPAFYHAEENLYGASFISTLLGVNELSFGETLSALAEAKFKAAYVLGTITAIITTVNYLIDVIALTTNAKKCGLWFNAIRYGLEAAAAICLIITAPVCGYGMGLFLVIIAALALIRLAISIIRIIRYVKTRKEIESDEADDAQALHFAKPVKAPKPVAEETPAIEVPEEKPSVPEFVGAEPIVLENQPEQPEQMAFIENAEPAPEPVEEPVEVIEHPDEVQMQIEVAEPEEDEYDDYEDEDEYDEEVVEEYVEPAPVEEKLVPLEPLKPLEPLEPLKPLEPLTPAEEDVKPAEPLQPVEAAPAEEKPAYTIKDEPATHRYGPIFEYLRPTTAKPVEEKKAEEKPVTPPPSYTQAPVEEKPAPAPQPVHEAVYNLRYGGPTDAFINKLTNDERIEFAMTFIEKKKGDITNLPEYVIGGDNRKFFNSVFIYLGRLRGLISDGLLNKMFKELNMM